MGKHGGTGDIALTAMFALLGLVLAFTYSFTISRADHRKQAVIDEANAIGTAFLRAAFAPEPMRAGLKSLLRDYAGTRLITAETAGTSALARQAIARSLKVQSGLWPVTARIVEYGARGPVEAAIFQSINEFIDMHGKRIAASLDQLPGIVLWMLLFVSGVSLAVAGYNRGLVGNMNRLRMTALALVLAAVMTIITDFDRGLQGFVKVSQQSLKDLIRDMDTALE